MKEENKKKLTYVLYAFIIFALFCFLVWMGHFKVFQDFITNIEQSSFDLRQTILSKYKKPNKDIVILAVDDATYEYIMDKYGSWPISRKIWADTINFIEIAKPKSIVMDLLFVKPNLNDISSDKALVETIKNNDNIFLSMNFDNYNDEIRKSPKIDDKFKLKIKDGYLENNEYITFINARTTMNELTNATKNIGAINVTRDKDGIIRNATPVFKYKGDYYPNLSLLSAMDYLNIDSISILDNNIILDKNHKIPLDMSQRAILNWYGKSGSYKHIPLWEVIKAQKENNLDFINKNFKDKVIYIGTTATSLSDIKSVPVEFNMSGVELHATFLNNILDNNFIKKSSIKTDFIISIILCLIVGYFVLKTENVAKTFLFLFATLTIYSFIALLLMQIFNLWITIIFPFITTITTFILIYCEKYLLKSKDYEQTYKLAVTDGLTQIYNHRYFQEQMLININNYNRYGQVFSIILMDIDFFKKFNDTYGHQSGDCVLQQVASILKKNSRTSDIVCRYGGEEMTIILTNTNKKDAEITANKICQAVRNNRFTLANGEKVRVTISVGVATVGENGSTAQEIIEYSDKCLYKAKETGRNRVVAQI